MACKYYYKGILIGDELQLNDFLIERKQYHSKYGDVVFKRSIRANSTIDKIDKSIIPESAHWKAKSDLMWKNGGYLYDDDGEKVLKYDKDHPPFIGVNRYIDRFGEADGQRLTAEFKPEEFWPRMFERWNQGNFENEDLNEIIQQVTGEDPKTVQRPLTEKTLTTWKEAIESKWKAQGKIGEAIHAVSEFYFGKINGVYNYEIINQDVDTAYNNFPYEFQQNVSKETFLKVLTMCQKLKQDLQKQYGEDCMIYPEIAMTCETQEEVLGSKRVYGIVDLLVIDEKGVPHLIDYKTSTKTYNNFHETKKAAYTYQLAVYERILANYGIRTDESTSTIVPIQIQDMIYDKNQNKWGYSGISYNMLQTKQDEVQQESITAKVKSDKVVSNINKFLPVKVKLSLKTEKLMENVA